MQGWDGEPHQLQVGRERTRPQANGHDDKFVVFTRRIEFALPRRTSACALSGWQGIGCSRIPSRPLRGNMPGHSKTKAVGFEQEVHNLSYGGKEVEVTFIVMQRSKRQRIEPLMASKARISSWELPVSLVGWNARPRRARLGNICKQFGRRRKACERTECTYVPAWSCICLR